MSCPCTRKYPRPQKPKDTSKVVTPKKEETPQEKVEDKKDVKI